jgi:hypothetical protein
MRQVQIRSVAASQRGCVRDRQRFSVATSFPGRVRIFPRARRDAASAFVHPAACANPANGFRVISARSLACLWRFAVYFSQRSTRINFSGKRVSDLKQGEVED